MMPDDPYWCPHCLEHHPVIQLVRDHVANGGKVDRSKEKRT